MHNDAATTTLLTAILQNQKAITKALSTLADWVEKVESETSVVTVCSVRMAVETVEGNRNIIGRCITQLMRDTGQRSEEVLARCESEKAVRS